MKRAVFPGSFDPITLGHCEIIKKAVNIFDEVIVAVGSNPDKKYHFSVNRRLEFIKNEFANKTKVKVKSYDGLTADFCKKIDAKYIVRGLRTSADFEFEKIIAHLKVCYDSCEESEHYGISNFIAERIDAHNKHQWMIRSTLKTNRE